MESEQRDVDSSGTYFLSVEDFEGRRQTREEALLSSLRDLLDAPTLHELLRAGCNGVCDKKVPGDLPEMLNTIDRCMQELADARSRPVEARTGVQLMRTFRNLFREWNRRLDRQA